MILKLCDKAIKESSQHESKSFMQQESEKNNMKKICKSQIFSLPNHSVRKKTMFKYASSSYGARYTVNTVIF